MTVFTVIENELAGRVRGQRDRVMDFVPEYIDPAQTVDGHGLEAEYTWQATDRLRVKGRYAYQSVEGVTNTLTLSPKHQVYAEGRWEFLPNWYADLSLKAMIDRERVEADPRPDIGDYTLVNLSLRRKNIGGMLDVALTVRNLFDVDVREPSISAVSIPNDIPLADRYCELRIRF